MTWEPARLQQPRFERVADLIARLAGERDWPSVELLDAAFRDELASVGVRLVESGKTKPSLGADGAIDPATLYEVRIVERGEIATRPRNAHDLLNALVWAAFPRSKLSLTRALADIQRARAAGRATLPSTRTREHDRLAMIDEGAVLSVRGSTTTSTWIFGHAIYEHAYAGELAVRGGQIDLEIAGIEALTTPAARAEIDRALSAMQLPSALRPGPGVVVVDGSRALH